MDFSLNKNNKKNTVNTVFLIDESMNYTDKLKEFDTQFNGLIDSSIKTSDFKGKENTSIEIINPFDTHIKRVFLFGVGDKSKKTIAKVEGWGGAIANMLNAKKIKDAAVELELLNDDQEVAHLIFGSLLGSYRFDKYYTKKRDEKKFKLESIDFLTSHGQQAQSILTNKLLPLKDGIFLTRNVFSETDNVIYPDILANTIKELTSLGLKVDLLDEAKMRKLGMNALLGVGQGSEKQSYLVTMEWYGADSKKDQPIAFIGKGVTFDTGGISIKPSGGMEDMKWDMGGSGTVIGLMKALAGRKAKANVIGVVGLVENMPSGSAQRPGDVVKSMSGQTIEVINTDAEGRLVLADALWYCQDKYKPKFMIDLATLTGAIIVSLGYEHAGLFSDDQELTDRLIELGKEVEEPVWQLPIGDEYDRQINSDIADMKNVGEGRAGSITAAQFLKRFTNGTPWAHLDIAGTAWSKKDKPTVPKGATAFGVKLLNKLVEKYYE